MQTVVCCTRVYFPLNELDWSMDSYRSYRSYMAMCLQNFGGDNNMPLTCASYCTTVAVITPCEWMCNSARVESLLTSFPANLKVYNLWREFGDPMIHMVIAFVQRRSVMLSGWGHRIWWWVHAKCSIILCSVIDHGPNQWICVVSPTAWN